MIDNGGVKDWILDPADFSSYREEALLAAAAAADEENDVTVPNFSHYGIRDMDTAESINRLTNVVSHLADRIYSGESLYIHCWGGKGRSGLVTSCLLGELYETVDADEALERVGEYCQSHQKSRQGSAGGRCRSIQKLAHHEGMYYSSTSINYRRFPLVCY